MSQDYVLTTGRRKNSVARVRLKPGSGKFVINGRNVEDYLVRPVLRLIANQPFEHLEVLGRFDVIANCSGGGHAGQAGALRHGISRALVEYDPNYRGNLKAAGFLTRDARKKERKKYGLHGARRGTQFSKR